MTSTPIKIIQPITAVNVVKPSAPSTIVTPLERPDVLTGYTYKIKTPLSEHALYITLNNTIITDTTGRELIRPFEIFINSKAMEHFQWIVALTRIISATLRQALLQPEFDYTLLVSELHSVFDPKGGYFKRGGRYMPSLVAEIGDVLAQHLRTLQLIPLETLDQHQQQHIAAARAKYEQRGASTGEGFPPEAALCSKCHVKAVIIMDGCWTCLSCGDSKCG